MPYKKSAKYYHHRRHNPGLFEKTSFRTIPIANSSYSGTKFLVPGAKVIVGKYKKTKKWRIQSILEPKTNRNA